jgi:hypothetical protein
MKLNKMSTKYVRKIQKMIIKKKKIWNVYSSETIVYMGNKDLTCECSHRIVQRVCTVHYSLSTINCIQLKCVCSGKKFQVPVNFLASSFHSVHFSDTDKNCVLWTACNWLPQKDSEPLSQCPWPIRQTLSKQNKAVKSWALIYGRNKWHFTYTFKCTCMAWFIYWLILSLFNNIFNCEICVPS